MPVTDCAIQNPVTKYRKNGRRKRGEERETKGLRKNFRETKGVRKKFRALFAVSFVGGGKE